MMKGVDRLSFLRRAVGMRDNPGDAIDVSSEDEDRERRGSCGCFRDTRDSATTPTVRHMGPPNVRLSGCDASDAHSYLKYGTKVVAWVRN